jgi:hypothetical protein
MSDLSNTRVVRAVAAVVTSIVAGATAGAALARKPLVVPVDRPRRPVASRR